MTTNIELQNWLEQFPDDLEILVLKEMKDRSGYLVWTTLTEVNIGDNVDYIECWPNNTPAIYFGEQI